MPSLFQIGATRNLKWSLGWNNYQAQFIIRYFIFLFKGDGKDIMSYVFLLLFLLERFSSKWWNTHYCMQESNPLKMLSPLLLPVGHPSHLTMLQHVRQSWRLIVPVLIYCLQYWGVGNSEQFPSVANHFVNRVLIISFRIDLLWFGQGL